MELNNKKGFKREQKKAICQLCAFAISICILFVVLEFSKKESVYNLSLPAWDCMSNLPHGLNMWLRGDLTWTGFFVVLVTVTASFVFSYNLFQWVKNAYYHEQKSQNIKLLGSLMFLLWSLGWGLYLQAFLYYPPEHHFVNSELLLRSAIASLDLFMLDIDSNILDVIKEHEFLKGAIAFVSLLSFACTVGLLVSLVYARLAAYLKLRFFTKVSDNHPHLYVFWGINAQTEQLAKSVGKNDAEGVKVFVELSKNSEDDEDGWSHLVKMLTHRRESFNKVKELNARLSIVGSQLTSISSENDEVLNELSLNSLRRQILKLKKVAANGVAKAELHLFFLSDNEETNIQSVAIIRNDKTIKAVSDNGVKVTIYCHARYDSVNRVIEDTSLSSSIQVRVIDSAHIAVELLKKSESQSLYPANFVKIEKDATVSTAFNSLVIGFGEAGQDAVRYLYEYGAFVDSNITGGIKRSPFCCHVVDNKMNIIAPHYMSTHLRSAESKSEENLLVSVDSARTAYVNLHNYDYHHSEFQDLLDMIIDELQYVIITVGDDIQGITLGVRILKQAIRKRMDIRNFKILVRSYFPSIYPHVQKIADYYNKLAYSELISTMQDDTQYNSSNNIKEPIVIFGKFEDIYSYSTIVSDEIHKESILYYNSYNRVKVYSDNDFKSLPESVKQEGKACSESQKDYAWSVRREKEMAFKVDGSTSFSSVMSVRRKEAQDVENALHRHVKRYVALKALDDDETSLRSAESSIRFEKVKRVYKPGKAANSIGRFVYAKDDKEIQPLTTIMNTLAQMEHLRWNASHEMLGYIKGEKKDEAILEHNCLTSWENLESDEIRGYDFDVVDRSFRLADEERNG